ncbi:hypothetical protein AAG906_033195 [Vitis piasezkii]
MFESFKNSMKDEFDMTDLGKMKYFLGVEVLQTSEGIYLSQKKYACELLEKFGLQNANSVKNPIVLIYKQLIGSLMYITATRPDLMYVVCLLSRYMANPLDLHMQAAKRVLRYLKGTVELGLLYKRGENNTSGYVFLLSGGAVSWASKKQPIVTMSTIKANLWQQLSSIQESVMHGRSKHIDVRFHFLRDLTKEEVVKSVHCGTNDQVADILTKPLKLEVFLKLVRSLGYVRYQT